MLGEGNKIRKRQIHDQNTELQANTRSNTELHVEVFPASWNAKMIKYQTACRDIPCVAGSVGLQHLQECEELMEGKAAQQHGYTARKCGSGQLMVVWGFLESHWRHKTVFSLPELLPCQIYLIV